MAALTAPKPIAQKGNVADVKFEGPYKLQASTTIFHGALISRNATSLVKASAAADAASVTIGVADLQTYSDKKRSGQAAEFGTTDYTKVASGASDDRRVLVRQGVFKFANKAGDLLTINDVGQSAFVEDDQTVRKTATASYAAGRVVEIDGSDVWVEVPALA